MITRDSTTKSPAQSDMILPWDFRTRRWALPIVLLAGLLAACESDRSVTGPERATAPSEATVNGEPEGKIAPAAATHWADGYAWADQPTSASYNPSSFYA